MKKPMASRTRGILCHEWLALPILFSCIVPGAEAWQQPSGLPAPQVAASQQALVKQYCVTCHNDKLKTASVSLEGLDLAQVADDAATWEKVLRKVSANQMPPVGLPQPQAGARKAFAAYLETELDRAAAAHPNPGTQRSIA